MHAPNEQTSAANLPPEETFWKAHSSLPLSQAKSLISDRPNFTCSITVNLIVVDSSNSTAVETESTWHGNWTSLWRRAQLLRIDIGWACFRFSKLLLNIKLICMSATRCQYSANNCLWAEHNELFLPVQSGRVYYGPEI